jgi:hypothetical protein
MISQNFLNRHGVTIKMTIISKTMYVGINKRACDIYSRLSSFSCYHQIYSQFVEMAASVVRGRQLEDEIRELIRQDLDSIPRIR